MTLSKRAYWQMIHESRNLATHYSALTYQLYSADCNFNAGAPVDQCLGADAILSRFGRR